MCERLQKNRLTQTSNALSPEELMAINEKRKAQAEAKKEEKRREAEERAIFLKKETLRREIELSALNTKRFRRAWQEMVMRAKMPFIKEDLEVAWHTFDRALDIKNYSISLLLDALDDAEEQYQMNERSHIESIDRLMQIYKTRLQNEEKNYHETLQEMSSTAYSENEMIGHKQTRDEAFQQAMIFAMKQHLDEFLTNIKSGAVSKVDALKIDNKTVQRIAKIQLEKQLDNLWEEVRHVLSEYLTDTKDRRKAHAVIKDKDDKERRILARQLARTAVLFESIRKFKEKILAFKATAENRVAEIMAEHDYFYGTYWTLKNRFLSEQNMDKTQLTILTVQYNCTMQHLKRLVTKGEHLLVLVQACRKFETQDEKVLPFTSPVETDDQTGKLFVQPDWKRSRMILNKFRNLEQFWRRTGAAQVITTELRLERDELKREARYLRECLKHCITERKLTESTTRFASTDEREEATNNKPVVIEARAFLKAHTGF